MSWVSTIGERVGALESTWSSSCSRIDDVELYLASGKSELAAVAENRSSTEHRLRFAEDAVAVRVEQVQGHGPQLFEVGSERATAKSAHAMVEGTSQSINMFAASNSVLRAYVD